LLPSDFLGNKKKGSSTSNRIAMPLERNSFNFEHTLNETVRLTNSNCDIPFIKAALSKRKMKANP
jgi:hypothetical protein